MLTPVALSENLLTAVHRLLRQRRYDLVGHDPADDIHVDVPVVEFLQIYIDAWM